MIPCVTPLGKNYNHTKAQVDLCVRCFKCKAYFCTWGFEMVKVKWDLSVRVESKEILIGARNLFLCHNLYFLSLVYTEYIQSHSEFWDDCFWHQHFFSSLTVSLAYNTFLYRELKPWVKIISQLLVLGTQFLEVMGRIPGSWMRIWKDRIKVRQILKCLKNITDS